MSLSGSTVMTGMRRLTSELVAYPRGALPRGAGHPRGTTAGATKNQRCIKEVTYEAAETIRH